QYDARQAGRYVSRCVIPADTFNEGRYGLGVNASSFGVRRYFMDENALAFNVDISGAPGTQWPEPRVGPLRPRLAWPIAKLDWMNKSDLRNILGDLPFTAEVDWMLRRATGNRSRKDHFNLDRLRDSLPAAADLIRPFASAAAPGKKVLFFSTLHYWIEQSA